ncbi:MAG: hypothetical protein IFK92_14130 [Acidobacteria bacterium]|nr:hypothetical protein [Candidatus Sulfomarinibacter kjeldsenii]
MDLDQNPGAESEEDLLADAEEGGNHIEEAVLLLEDQASRGSVASSDIQPGIQDPGDQGASGCDRVEERIAISESAREKENDPDADDGSEVAGATELTEATPFLAALSQLEPDRSLDRKDDGDLSMPFSSSGLARAKPRDIIRVY